MCDTQVRRPMASPFEKGVDFGLIIPKSPFMAEDKDPLVLSNYILSARNPTTSPYASPFPSTAWHSHMPLGGSKKAARR